MPTVPRKTPTNLVAIRHMVVGVLTFVEISLTRIGIEGRSRVSCYRNLDEHTLDCNDHNPRPSHIRDYTYNHRSS